MFTRILFAALMMATVLLVYYVKQIPGLRKENEALRKQLSEPHPYASAINEVNFLLDSIDATLRLASIDLDDNKTASDRLGERLRAIAAYVKLSEEKIKQLQSQLGMAQNEASAYFMMMDALKSEVDMRMSEVASLEVMVLQYEKENQSLYQHMRHKDRTIESKHAELVVLESKIHGLLENMKLTEADAVFNKAKSVEEEARKTFLAPVKKEEGLREALLLYDKAFVLGRNDAKRKIMELEKVVSRSPVLLSANN